MCYNKLATAAYNPTSLLCSRGRFLQLKVTTSSYYPPRELRRRNFPIKPQVWQSSYLATKVIDVQYYQRKSRERKRNKSFKRRTWDFAGGPPFLSAMARHRLLVPLPWWGH